MCEQCNKEKVNHIGTKIGLIVAFIFFYNRVLNLTRNSNLDDSFLNTIYAFCILI